MPLRHGPGEGSPSRRPEHPTGPGRPSPLPAAAIGDNAFRFLASIVEPGLVWQYDLSDERQITGARVWSDDGSIVHLHPGGTVTEAGPRPLWGNLEAAHSIHRDADKPGPDRYGVTIEDRSQRVWLDAPNGPSWALRL